MTIQIKKYTSEFKQETVNLALKSPSIAKTATELDIPVATLHSWVNQLKGKTNSNTENANKWRQNARMFLYRQLRCGQYAQI